MLTRTPPLQIDVRALPLEIVCEMFERLGDVAFYVKDLNLHYLCGNSTTHALCGVKDDAEFAGKAARDFFSPVSQRCDDAADAQVLRTAAPSAEGVLLTLRLNGEPVWLSRRRWPWLDESNRCVGVIGIGLRLDPPQKQNAAHVRVARAVEQIETSFREPYDVTGLARRVGVSVSQLERDFLVVLGLAPRAYIAKVRLETALELLQSDAAIAEIAHACGYCDQSAFTRRFRRATGMSPSQYRRMTGAKSRGEAKRAPDLALSAA